MQGRNAARIGATLKQEVISKMRPPVVKVIQQRNAA
jgi:hypothetical protein